VFLSIAAPWYLWEESENLRYLRYFILEENVLHYLTPHFDREQPWYYHGGVLAVGFFPWTALIYLSFKNVAASLKDERRLFLILWMAVPLLVFSFSAANSPATSFPSFRRWLFSSPRRSRLPYRQNKPRLSVGTGNVVLGVKEFLEAWDRLAEKVMVFVEE